MAETAAAVAVTATAVAVTTPLVAVGTALAVVAAVAGVTAAVITNNRYTVIANATKYPIIALVDGEEANVESGHSRKFAVKQATPVRIRVTFDDRDHVDNLATIKEKGGDVASVKDTDHRNFIVKQRESGTLMLIRARKFRIWKEE